MSLKLVLYSATFFLPSFLQLSYQIVDALIWLGIRDMINEFRKKKLKLRPITYLSGSYLSPHDVPHAYIWSPHLVPKPKGCTFMFCRFKHSLNLHDVIQSLWFLS